MTGPVPLTHPFGDFVLQLTLGELQCFSFANKIYLCILMIIKMGEVYMPDISFKKFDVESTFLDPPGFSADIGKNQVRLDPLTGRTGHYSHFGAITPQQLDLEKYLEQQGKEFCPFCSALREELTPKFPGEIIPEGRLARGEALLVPNLHPYDVYSSVCIMTRGHVVPLAQFSYEHLHDSFSLGFDFLKRVKAIDPSLPYQIMGWNYMPPSGGGLIHPHQQYFATGNPGNQFKDELRASERFTRVVRGTTGWS